MNFFKKIAREIGRVGAQVSEYAGGIPILSQSALAIAALGRSVGGSFGGYSEKELWQKAALSQGQLLSQVASYYTSGVSGFLGGALTGSGAYSVAPGSKAVTLPASLLSGVNPLTQVLSGGDGLRGLLNDFLNVPGVAAQAGIKQKTVTYGENYSFAKAMMSSVLGGFFGGKKRSPVLPISEGTVYRAPSGAVYKLDDVTKYLGLGTGGTAWAGLIRLLSAQGKQSAKYSVGPSQQPAKQLAPPSAPSSLPAALLAALLPSAGASAPQPQVSKPEVSWQTSVLNFLGQALLGSTTSSTSGSSGKPSVSPPTAKLPRLPPAAR